MKHQPTAKLALTSNENYKAVKSPKAMIWSSFANSSGFGLQ